jgi:hypothetical protein
MTAFRRLTPLPTLQAEGVKLVPAGKDRYRCACPVHRGDHLSMAVSDNGARWTLVCHACGFVGGAIDLVRALTGCSFVEAVKRLGGELTAERSSPVELHPVDYTVLRCDAADCSNSMRVEAATYKTPGRAGGLFTRTSTEEAFTRAALAGWEMSAFGEFAICPPCVERHDRIAA